MIRIAITAGGTGEQIDGIRRITNLSTGSLGWYCLEAVIRYFKLKSGTDFHVDYIHAENAVIRSLQDTENRQVTFYPVTDAVSVHEAVDDLTRKNKVDYFIHAMAISDFTFSYAVAITRIAEEIEALQKIGGFSDDDVSEVLINPRTRFSDNEKIPSDDDIILGLKRTEKVIPVIKRNNPETFLVGFKLLNDVDEHKLIEAANKLTEKNGCDLVFANMVSAISESSHRGILIQNGRIVARPEGKKQIAETIVETMVELHRSSHS